MDPKSMFSLHVSRALDCLGKSQDMVKFRVEYYKRYERADTFQQASHANCIIAGSKGEGLTAPYESDLDKMYSHDGVFCADDISQFTQLPACSVFETKRRCTAPGYTKLRLVRLQYIALQLCESLIKDENDQFYISSDFFMQYAKNLTRISELMASLERSGPAMATVSKKFDLKEDIVTAFPCICPQVTQPFLNRHREFGWPSNDQLIEISSLEGHVVPVGYKGSDTAFLEWRICYTEAERLLMRSLNDTQTKVYILLKMVAKTRINSTAITSYFLKNVVLWLAECQDINTFKEELLVDRFIQALKFLCTCINNNNLPSYIIPERNLIFGKLDLGQRQKLVILLTGLINEGGGVLMNCEKLRATMLVLYKEPARAEQYRFKWDMIEKLWLSMMMKLYEKEAAGTCEEHQGQLLDMEESYNKLIKSLYLLISQDNMALLHISEEDDALFALTVVKILWKWLS